MKKFNRLTAVLQAGVTAASLTGGAVSVFADSDVTVIKGVTSGSLAPYFYVGDDNELTGVDIDIVKEVFNRLPQYELQIDTADALQGVISGPVRHCDQQLRLHRRESRILLLLFPI